MIDLRQGDCLWVMAGIPDGSIDAVVTDPPYSSGGLHIGSKHQPPSVKYQSEGHWSDLKAYPTYAGDSCDQWSWMLQARSWAMRAYSLCREGGHLYVFSDWRQLGSTIAAVQMGCWQYRGLIVWDKGNTARAPYPGSWRHGAEFLVWGSKGKPWTVTEGEWKKGVAPVHSVLRVNGVHNKCHVTEKPIEVLDTVISTCCPPGATVLDPFMGSGSTGVACVRAGRNFIGVELSAEYFAIAQRRIADEQAKHALLNTAS